ncbi:winged helix DNA-binding domain-containing protein [Quadrisphaera sp. INWT6]|uniref:winged helix DNA-binding domain-containing protein n=1 Tax=Quadrisphaera sp. INWT6 TaxID=2596917 RepID=UPI0018923C51|nr:winged helix DNA-binding domain-containing protein [Quadrisphaera sp. INWT6]
MPEAFPAVPAPVADLTPDDVARLRLVSQRLVAPPGPGGGAGLPEDPAAAVAHLLAVQGQDLPASLVAVASRTPERDADAVRAALDDGAVVRTWPMRGTLHLLAAQDAAWMTRLLGPRAARAASKRWLDAGLDDAAFDRASAVAAERLAGGPASRDALGEAWTAAGFEPGTATTYRLLNGLATRGELVLGPTQGTGGPGGRFEQLVALASTWLPEGSRPGDYASDDPDDVLLADLAGRYAAGHGPVSVADLVRWTYQTAGVAKGALAAAAARGRLVTVTCEGRTLVGGPELAGLVADLDAVRERTAEVLLLAAFDEVVLGYADRSAVLDPAHEVLVVPGGNGVFRPVVVADGRAVGTWARTGRHRDQLAVEPFGDLAPGVLDAAHEAFSRLPLPE